MSFQDLEGNIEMGGGPRPDAYTGYSGGPEKNVNYS